MLKAQNRLGIIFFPAYDWAISPTHPEREERLLYTQDQLREEGLFDIEGITEHKPDIATAKDIERVHFCFPDVSEVTTKSHFISAGGAIRAGRLVMEGTEDKAFAMVRPPGHHAMKCVHGNRGFCNINIEAIMIEHIRANYGHKRVAVVDTDCHHGDGSQDVFWHDPDTLFISLHQDGRTLYPGTGFPQELGGPNAFGKTINIPLPPNTSDEGFLYVIENVVKPLLDDFKPDLVINSAGQDNHFTDPITNMNFSAQGYAKLNELVNPDIAVLEGGYSIQGALPYVNLGICLAMAGADYSGVREPNYDPDQLRQPAKVTDYIKDLSDSIRELYFDPPRGNIEGRLVNGMYVRDKSIFYDTDGINENQVESITKCDDCPGVLKIESRSTVNPLSVGIQIPRNCCPKCYAKAMQMWEDAQIKGNYRYLKLINLKDDDIQSFGF
ncbi:histone deacetylase family protein [Desulfobaculum bizertense]|uniref:Acetoin utilization deacetylase AcuC n=1 Tax=Desulfobaculum bizertense DSM 18034 TaxID=1121442 RepID=A0A1T4WCV3_9BACT|nr:histone deacetylase [Desulfobaculum bizertense]UIJ37419.1 histone deacetylase [Desulfobaculum bizertense]SKA74939.1 Acetoin utilization deacetylase AcuC [Desulfobaculum bizertense DSM 18034]